MDVLVPGVGELIGGSQREERYDKLQVCLCLVVVVGVVYQTQMQ